MKKLLILAALSAMAMGVQASYTVSLAEGAEIYRGNDTDTYSGTMYILTGSGYDAVQGMAEYQVDIDGTGDGLRSMFQRGETIDIDAINAKGDYHVESFQVEGGSFEPIVVDGTLNSTYYTLFAVMDNVNGQEGSYILTFKPVSKMEIDATSSKKFERFTPGTGQVVPEPTSGLLLLLGVAGLALKRKCA